MIEENAKEGGGVPDSEWVGRAEYQRVGLTLSVRAKA